ncbi:5'-methylthioadenosine/S-adenosylhomocysteine nucleosidase [Saccharopolyspora hordei]|uniref:Nucleoside phosphorylase n=1 Tax=Saccharopolyspora hordei TaxID=1838 RepID=A0A853AKX7_9PSEU|nr:5'-methylthioadenosine/S-adenosylhomocysteine nucleosidase [Saccharopolyspora hordei]NYI85364.1 nucleoside phosphorylase [Saccharopolyspora hordei]
MTENVVVVLTALNLEYEAVRRRLTDLQVHRHERGTRFEVGTVRGTRCRIALGLTDKGNHSAAVLAERAVQEFSSVAVLFVGVAGALWDDMPLGDVVVAKHVYAYHGGTSEDDGLKSRPRVWETDHGISQLASHLARTGDWLDGVPAGPRTPRVHFGPIAAGEIVHNSRISYEARWLREYYNDALAIEMESAGVAQAGHLSGTPVAVVRGISDRADGTKATSTDREWQPRAADHAAAFGTRLAVALIEEQGETTMRRSKHEEAPRSVTNIATGSSQVAIQAGYVSGNVVYMGTTSQGSTSVDLGAELAAIRDRLMQERSAGNVDEITYEAAQAELDTATKAADCATPEDKRTFVVALKKLRGLVDDLADLAAMVTALITAANGLS